MGQPAPRAHARRELAVFLLTLVTVVVGAAFAGYLLGQYAFSRWVGWVPPATGPRQAQALAPIAPEAPAGSEPAAPAPGAVPSTPPAGQLRPWAGPTAPSAEAGRSPAVAAPEAAAPAAPGAGASAAPAPPGRAPGAAPGSAPGGAPGSAPAGLRTSAAFEEEYRARTEGYFVQVAAFSRPEAASRAVAQLGQQGFAARVVVPSLSAASSPGPGTGAGPGGGAGAAAPSYKVWVGPYRLREEAVAARERLKAQWPGAWIP